MKALIFFVGGVEDRLKTQEQQEEAQDNSKSLAPESLPRHEGTPTTLKNRKSTSVDKTTGIPKHEQRHLCARIAHA
jgi:hypothetical protein